MDKIEKILKKLTLEEKFKLIHGNSFWLFNSYTKELKDVSCSDGPNGIRKQVKTDEDIFVSGIHSVLCTTFPTGSTYACSFDPALVREMGKDLANEFQFYQINVALGPAACIKRNPLCGRNFEYLSEDPILSGYIAGHYIKGLEENNVGTSLKHYVTNNQEYGRQINSSTLSIKCLRDIYTRGFEIAARIGNPASIMVSYNKINGTYACENHYIMEDVLRNEDGYKGIFVSDWTAVNDPFESIKAGLTVEMPERNYGKEFYLNGIKDKKITEKDLDNVLKYYIPFVDKYSREYKVDKIDYEGHLKTAIKVAENSIVLAKNDDSFFPLSNDQEVVVLGLRAKNMVYSGGGSSLTNSYHKPDFINVLDEKKIHYTYVDGYDDNGNINLSILKGIKNQKVLVFLGHNAATESEGFDRKDMKLPLNQLNFMEELAKVTHNVGVIIESGSVVELPFLNNVKGVFIPYFAGEGEDYALYNLIYGLVNPSGKLSETWIKKYEDCPSSSSYDKDIYNSYYDEDIYVGYRYYDKHNIKVNFPFGFGLNYSSFKINLLRTAVNQKNVKCEVEVFNNSPIKGKEVVEIYVGKKDSNIYRAKRELIAFNKVEVQANSKKRVVISINNLDLRVYDPSTNKMVLEDGNYELYVGNSSQDKFIISSFSLKGEKIKKYDLVGPDHSLVYKASKDMNLLVTDALTSPTLRKLLNEHGITDELLTNSIFKDGFLKNPIRGLSGLGVDYEQITNLLPQIIKEYEASIK